MFRILSRFYGLVEVPLVQMWTKTVDERLKNHFQMTDSKDAFNAEMHKASNDFEHALTHLLGYEQVQKGTIYMCSSKNETQNNHLAIEGQFTDTINALKQSPLLHWLYFRLSAAGKGQQTGYFGGSRFSEWPH